MATRYFALIAQGIYAISVLQAYISEILLLSPNHRSPSLVSQVLARLYEALYCSSSSSQAVATLVTSLLLWVVLLILW